MKLSDIQPGQQIIGLQGDDAVTIVAVHAIDDNLIEVTYRTADNKLQERLVSDTEASALIQQSTTDIASIFDCDADDFKLAAEALRIKYAALYDPFVAVNSSAIEPLPHQIRAVYEELLPRMPLRFLLADDPGAGKTIMAGLYLKELILRSDCERALIVVPGGLADQWQEELHDKFNLDFEVLSRLMLDATFGQNVFSQHNYLIARMDQLARNDDLLEQLRQTSWDIVIVDEAHRMSAQFSSWQGDIKRTKRFELGQVLAETTQNLLLMTATPHSGSEENFQLFMSLLDKDRFEGKYREEAHNTSTDGLMRRMIKEELKTFDGKPLFPERRAYTVPYELSPAEQQLYDDVTDYVRTEMGRADVISASGDKRRGNNIGFALTVLQRRLASSPEAILRTLERRRARLSERLRDITNQNRTGSQDRLYLFAPSDLPDISFEELDDDYEDLNEDERRHLDDRIDAVTDQATAAMTIEELEAEIAILDGLVDSARQVRARDEDTKWVELRRVLSEQLISGAAGESTAGENAAGETDSTYPQTHKIIIFTEHRDTLNYLVQKTRAIMFGRDDAVVTIHGGTRREDRKLIQEQFANNPSTQILIATDAAGEGLNLQRAHLMVNYDLPWNPNRIEQRFGRIHRIGQKSVCHLWNLVAEHTREGEVYKRLLDKLETMSRAYNGKVFDILGDKNAFDSGSLRDLLLEAIRYGDKPEVKARLNEVIDRTVSEGLPELLAERALNNDILSARDLDGIRQRMELARERRLQPGYIKSFFIDAFTYLGGRIHRREGGFFQITRVPRRVIDAARNLNRWAPVADAYERVTFDTVEIDSTRVAQPVLISPGHPLLDAVIELVLADLEPVLRRGTVLIDDTDKQAGAPTLLYALEQRVENTALGYTASRHFDFIELGEDGVLATMAAPPYLDYRAPEPGELEAVAGVRRQDWLNESHEQAVKAWAWRTSLQPRLDELKAAASFEAERVRRQVDERLTAQINHWDIESSTLAGDERAGKVGRRTSRQAWDMARSLEARLEQRHAELDKSTLLAASPSVIRGTALVVPSSCLVATQPGEIDPANQTEKQLTERRAVDMAIAAERSLGRVPVEQARNNKGFDILSTTPEGEKYFLEVKGRLKGGERFNITDNEVRFAQSQKDRHRLVLVSVDLENPANDQIRYVGNAFGDHKVLESTKDYSEDWSIHWENGGPPF